MSSCRSLWLILNFTACLAAITVWARIGQPHPTSKTESTAPVPADYQSAPTLDGLQLLADLVTLRVHVSDILTVDQPGWLNGYRGAWIVKGDAVCVTDLKRARLSVVDDSKDEKLLRIELPKPAVSAARLDHTRTRTYDLRAKGWLPLLSVPESVRNEALLRAQQIVERTANHPDHVSQAQRQSEAVLATFYAATGFRTEIVWHESDWDGLAAPTSLPSIAVDSE